MKVRSLYLGLISGTSMDGIDAAIVDLNGQHKIVHSLFAPYQKQTHSQLLQLIQSADHCSLDQLGRLDYAIAVEFAAAANQVIQQAGLSAASIAAIGSHGQTVRHSPADGTDTTTPPFTLQIGDPNVIAEQTGITTVADFRRRDMAAGGQGAPLVPAFHAALLENRRPGIVVNIGGIANITVVDTEGSVFGFDTGPGNCLMDQWMQRHYKQNFDSNGDLAAGGKSVPELLVRLLDDPYFKQTHPKSTGPEYFNSAWLQPHLSGTQNAQNEDILFTLNQLTATSIAKSIKATAPGQKNIYICGGGAQNATLMRELAALLSEHNVMTTTEIDIDPNFVEAAAFAWLAKSTLSGRPGNIPAVTGARHSVVLGAIYPAG